MRLIFRVFEKYLSFDKPSWVPPFLWSVSLKLIRIAIVIAVIWYTIFFLLIISGNLAYGSWNYRITVEVETPEGIMTGSTVRKAFMSTRPALLGESSGGNSMKVIGEAVVIDLGERGHVFGLITWSSYREMLDAFPLPRTRSHVDEIKMLKKMLKPGKKAEVSKDYIRMSAFVNMDDPRSIKMIKGSKLNIETQKREKVDNFEDVFGEGVRLHKITVEITDDPVTWGVVDRYLPSNFVSEVKDKWQTLSFAEQSRINKLTDFKQGEP